MNPSTEVPGSRTPYYVSALAMAIPALMLGFQISGWIFFVASVRDGHPDFRANYSAGYMARSGQVRQLYDYDAQKTVQDRLISREQVAMPFIHPAYESLLYATFSVMSFHRAYIAFLATNLLLLSICVYLLRQEMEALAQVWWLLPFAIFFTYLPVAAALMQGQDSIILLALTVIAFSLLDRGDDLPAGLILGLGVFRFQLTIPIAVLFLLERRWRFAAGFAVSGVLAAALSVLLVGVSQTKFYLRSLASMSIGGVSALEQVRYQQPLSHMGNLRGLVDAITSAHFAPTLVQATVIAASLAVVLWTAIRFRQVGGGGELLLLGVVMAEVVSYHMFIHDMSLLALPIAVLLNRSIRTDGRPKEIGRGTLGACAMMFVAPALIIFAPYHFYLVCLAMIALLVALSTEFPIGVKGTPH